MTSFPILWWIVTSWNDLFQPLIHLDCWVEYCIVWRSVLFTIAFNISQPNVMLNATAFLQDHGSTDHSRSHVGLGLMPVSFVKSSWCYLHHVMSPWRNKDGFKMFTCAVQSRDCIKKIAVIDYFSNWTKM